MYIIRKNFVHFISCLIPLFPANLACQKEGEQYKNEQRSAVPSETLA